jgi:hypothetical protein
MGTGSGPDDDGDDDDDYLSIFHPSLGAQLGGLEVVQHVPQNHGCHLPYFPNMK